MNHERVAVGAWKRKQRRKCLFLSDAKMRILFGCEFLVEFFLCNVRGARWAFNRKRRRDLPSLAHGMDGCKEGGGEIVCGYLFCVDGDLLL